MKLIEVKITITYYSHTIALSSFFLLTVVKSRGLLLGDEGKEGEEKDEKIKIKIFTYYIDR